MSALKEACRQAGAEALAEFYINQARPHTPLSFEGLMKLHHSMMLKHAAFRLVEVMSAEIK